jgi:hypothetical protein
MTSQKEFIEVLINKLTEQKISYMLSGSISSSLHGHPRATQDVDIVISPTDVQLMNYINSLGEDYYVSSEAVREAFAHNSMFNVIDIKSGWKADFIIRKARPFSLQEFKRRLLSKIEDMDVWVTSPEDIILCKLEWAKDSQSTQQFRDALGVAIVQWEKLDKTYLQKWAKDLKVEDSLRELFQQAEKML